MRKELRPTHEMVSCAVCGRTILKGERTEAYLAPGGQRKIVCELCTARADHEGWIRESAHGDMPATRRPREPRRSLIGRLRRGREEPVRAPEEPAEQERSEFFDVEHHQPEPEQQDTNEQQVARTSRRRKDPRHVRAVPTNSQVKIERALEMFNGSDHTRTISGIARTLGLPWVSAIPSTQAPSEVEVVVAWELSWYRYRIDLGDERDPVTVLDKGQEIEELDEPQREWNAFANEDGHLGAGVVSTER
ncbi:MAG TPA: hypothetical protein VN606_12525 [Thermoleophilaceae bacterium]|nr:hypothetical protein [Thermoleophilaceae bacterium]